MNMNSCQRAKERKGSALLIEWERVKIKGLKTTLIDDHIQFMPWQVSSGKHPRDFNITKLQQ